MRAVETLLADTVSAQLLDVATGSADIPRALRRWAVRHGRDLRIVATDVSPEIVRIARRHLVGADVHVARADARSLPWPDSSFDVVTCCLALHHFEPDDAVRVLQEMWRVSTRGIIVTDLRRTYPAFASTWLAVHTIARNRLTRHDGPLSVLRAYTPAELMNLAREAGIDGASVHCYRFFRQVLTGVKHAESHDE